MIGKLLGRRQVQTTARYVHLAWHSVKAAPRKIEESLAADMDKPLGADFTNYFATILRRVRD